MGGSVSCRCNTFVKCCVKRKLSRLSPSSVIKTVSSQHARWCAVLKSAARDVELRAVGLAASARNGSVCRLNSWKFKNDRKWRAAAKKNLTVSADSSSEVEKNGAI